MAAVASHGEPPATIRKKNQNKTRCFQKKKERKKMNRHEKKKNSVKLGKH